MHLYETNPGNRDSHKHVLDINKPHQKYFEEISRIPRMSFHEQAVSDYIVSFAKERGLWVHQDSIGNVIIKKSAPEGCSREPVMLQAHLDMVCEKSLNSGFDFLTDSIRLIAEDGWLTADGTTLGADDGAGVALILAVLDRNDIKHPPLECVFTVQEEDGMGGALQLDYSRLTARKLIALDGLEEGTTIVSTTGVHSGYIRKKFSTAPDNSSSYLLKISGLRGGHAALNIGKGQGNAIKTAADILSAIGGIPASTGDTAPACLRLTAMKGGTILNGIPGSCEVLFTFSGDQKKLQEAVESAVHEIKTVLGERDPELTVELLREAGPVFSMDENLTKEVIQLIRSLPAGVKTWHADIPGFPAASRNLGTISTEANEIKTGYSCRGISMEEVRRMAEETAGIAETHHAVYQEEFQYPGYTVSDHSPLISLWASVYQEYTGKELIRRRIHSGTDAGTISEKMGGMEIIVLMPNTRHVHTPEERMELASFDRTCQYLFRILERL